MTTMGAEPSPIATQPAGKGDPLDSEVTRVDPHARPKPAVGDVADSRRRRVVIGVISVALTIGCAATIFAALSPLLATPDETAHVDYAYQVWHGQLPTFADGTVFLPGDGAKVPPVQWVAQHPPLYYLLIAPAAGPLIDAGEWQSAVLAARGINVLLAVLLLCALAWAGSLLALRRRWAWAIAVPAVIAPISPFLRVGGSVYNDNLATLFVVLALGLAIQVIRCGPNRSNLALIAIVCGLGALTRGNFIVTVLVLTVALPLGLLLNDGPGGRFRWWKAAGSALLPFGAALLVAGWFYVRNIELTGTWTGGHADWAQANLDRTPRPLFTVLTTSDFWGRPFALLLQVNQSPAVQIGQRLMVVTGAIGTVAILGWTWRSHRAGATGRHAAPANWGSRVKPLAVGAVLVAQAAGTLGAMAAHVATGGGEITRYLLPALLPIGAILAAGVLAFGRLGSGGAFLLYAAVAWGLFIHWIWVVTADNRGVGGETVNSVSNTVVWLALVVLVTSVVTTAVVLTDVQRRRTRPRTAPDPGD